MIARQLAISAGCATVIVGLPLLVLELVGVDPMVGFVIVSWFGVAALAHHWLWGEG